MIKMGNDEFILYIRKNYPKCETKNAALGHAIWEWIEKHDPDAVQVELRQECYWADRTARTRGNMRLPNTAAQFRFSRALLPDLYTFLDELGSK